MFWPLVSAAGFLVAVGLVIVLARGHTARWESERAAADEKVRRRRAHQRALLARSGIVAASSVRRRRWHRPRGTRRSSGRSRSGQP
jgi:cytochrome c-type biogenesis protein CcmH/NrfG